MKSPPLLLRLSKGRTGIMSQICLWIWLRRSVNVKIAYRSSWRSELGRMPVRLSNLPFLNSSQADYQRHSTKCRQSNRPYQRASLTVYRSNELSSCLRTRHSSISFPISAYLGWAPSRSHCHSRQIPTDSANLYHGPKNYFSCSKDHHC